MSQYEETQEAQSLHQLHIRSSWQRIRRVPRMRCENMIRKFTTNVIGWGTVVITPLLAGIWCASYFIDCSFYWEITEKRTLTAGGRSGNADLFFSDIRETPPQIEFIWGHHPFQGRTWHSFGVYSYDQKGWQHSGLIFPIWSALFLSVGIATLFIRGPVRRHRRRRRNHCLHCGYNLTGLSDPRCPECGRPFSVA